MKVLIIDNYDSFTFNLYQLIGEVLKADGTEYSLDVVKNDELTFDTIQDRNYDRICISPGPGSVEDERYFGVCGRVLTMLGQHTPILGVCLGMQGMAHFFGGKVILAKNPLHGKTSMITHDRKGIFEGIPQHIAVMRYHSLVVDKKTLPSCLEVSAVSSDTDEIMGLRHSIYPIEGIQFHPESFRTEAGRELITNFITQ